MSDAQHTSSYRRASASQSLQFIRISGADARSFLQGQLSADMNQLSHTQPLDAALCNLQGRVIADLRLALAGDDIVVQLTAGMAETVVATLKKYAVFSKVCIEIDSQWIAAAILPDDPLKAAKDFALFAEPLARSLGLDSFESGQCVSSTQRVIIAHQQPLPWLELWSATGQAEIDALAAPDPLWTWPALDALAGRLRITPALGERFTPAQLNYDLAGLINFKKGCYTGQEVVARMHYRGKAKKRLALLIGNTAISDGDFALTCLDQQPAAQAEQQEAARFTATCLQCIRLAQPVSSNAVWRDAPAGLPEQANTLIMALMPVEFVTPGARFSLTDSGDSCLTAAPLPYTLPYTD
jgi:folate-binding protein YgfZ